MGIIRYAERDMGQHRNLGEHQYATEVGLWKDPCGCACLAVCVVLQWQRLLLDTSRALRSSHALLQPLDYMLKRAALSTTDGRENCGPHLGPEVSCLLDGRKVMVPFWKAKVPSHSQDLPLLQGDTEALI